MSDENKDLVVVGAIMGAHGVRGDVRVKSFTADPEAVFDYAPFLLNSGEIALDPQRARPAKDHFIVTPAKTRQKEEWDALKGTKLYVPRASLPAPEEDEYYIDDLVGLGSFRRRRMMRIGRVKAVLNHGASDLIEIQLKAPGGKPVLIPFTQEDVPVDRPRTRPHLVVVNFEMWADETPPRRRLGKRLCSVGLIEESLQARLLTSRPERL